MTTISQKTLLELVKENDRDTGSDGERHSSEETTMEEKQNNEATTATPPQTIPTPSGSGDERPATPPSTASKSDLPILREDITDESTQSLDDSTAHPQSRMSPEASKDYFSRSFDDISVLDKSDKSSSNEKIPDMSSSKGEKDGSKSGKGSNKKSSNISWYNVWNTSYKAKCEDFRKIFGKHIPDTERLVVDYSCALQKDILVHGRLYLTQNWLCFYANIFRWETLITVKCKDVTAITKERTARVIPNAIQLCTHTEKYFFTSFASRDKTFMILFRLWQNALLDQAMSPQDFWTWVRMNYGDEVGMDSEEVIEPYNAGTPNDSRDEGASDGSISMENGIVNRKAGQALSLPLEKQDLSPDSPSNRGMTNDSLQDSSSFLQTPSYAADESSLNTTESECIIQPQEISMGTPPVKLSPEKSTKTQTKALPSPSVNDRGIFGQKDKDKTSDNLPTDESDFTEGEVSELEESSSDLISASDLSDHDQDKGEVICPCTEHPGRKCVSEVYDFPVDILFDMLFADKHTFYKDFLEARKTTNYIAGQWETEEFGKYVRHVDFVVRNPSRFGPRKVPTTITQTTYKDVCKEGQLYVVDTEVVNHGIPYGDNFYVANRYCLTRVSSTQSRLRVSCEIRYRKSVWGLVKTIIEKNAGAGISDNFKMLDNYLIKASHAPVKRKKTAVVRRRKRSQNKCIGDISDDALLGNDFKTSTPAISPQVSPMKGSASLQNLSMSSELSILGIQVDTRKFMISIVVILTALLLFNIALFNRLKTLESAASQGPAWQSAVKTLSDIPKTSQDWSDLLKQQQFYHDTELERWREILSISIQLLDQMKGTLIDLKSGIKTSDERLHTANGDNKGGT